MLEIRPNCEHCNKNLPYNSEEAMICSFECTYCKECALELFENVCPSCSGNFNQRPIRPSYQLKKHPASTIRIFIPKNYNFTKHNTKIYKNIPAIKR
ncbi:DUF1272 domain-containing protein [Tenacibaculum sp. nBUS_03]|uniref:DUF1272 domain-containing protein n=1 Tax=Tenacibaculum sp. nBUS_03 TaxID=3395320 RepID=UPI003EB91B47